MRLRTNQDTLTYGMAMNKQQELLVITMEECGELIQSCSKILRSNDATGDNLKNLQDEAGDVWCMLHLMIQKNLISEEILNKRKIKKLSKLKKWSKLLDED